MSVIYLDDVNMNFGVMDVLKGTGPIYISNAAYSPAGVKPYDQKNDFKVKKSASTTGTYYSAPPIYFRKSGGQFIPYPKLCLTPNKATRSTFTITKPYESTKLKTNLVTRIIFRDAPWNEKILIIDQRLTMMLDILLACKLLDIDLKAFDSCANNQDFFKAMNKLLQDKEKTTGKIKNSILYTQDYIDLWTTPPTMYKYEEKYIQVSSNNFNENLDQIEEDPKSFEIKGVCTQLFAKLSPQNYPGFTTSNSNFRAMHTRTAIRKKKVEDGESPIAVTLINNLRFKIKTAENKVPDSLCSKRLIKQGPKLVEQVITEAAAQQLWGGADSKFGATYDGFIICSIRYDLSVYKMGSTYCRWDVEQWNGKYSASAGSRATNPEELPDIYDDDEDDTLPPAADTGNTGTIDVGDDI